MTAGKSSTTVLLAAGRTYGDLYDPGYRSRYDRDPDAAFAEFLQTADAIAARGFTVRTAVPNENLFKESFASGYKPFTTRLLEQRPELAVIVDDPQREDHRLAWPRDAFHQFGSQLFVATGRKEDVAMSYKLLRALGVTTSAPKRKLGEGGVVVTAGNIALISEQQYHSAPAIEKLGYETICIPVKAEQRKHHWQHTFVGSNGHIDSLIQLGQKPDNSYFICSSTIFAERNSATLTQLAKRFDAPVHIADKYCQREINFLSLPDRSVVVQQGTTADFLQQQVGYENVIIASPIMLEHAEDGGLRCRSNIIEFDKLATPKH